MEKEELREKWVKLDLLVKMDVREDRDNRDLKVNLDHQDPLDNLTRKVLLETLVLLERGEPEVPLEIVDHKVLQEFQANQDSLAWLAPLDLKVREV